MAGIDDNVSLIGDWIPPTQSPRTFFTAMLGDDSGSKQVSKAPLENKSEGLFLGENSDKMDVNQGCEPSNESTFEQKSSTRAGLLERMAARAGFNAPRLNTENIRSTDTSLNPEIRSPYLTIPPGLSPTTLLESPVFVSNSLAQPSPTTGKFSFIPNVNDRSCIPESRDKSEDNYFEDINASSFAFKPIAESNSSFLLGAMSKVTPASLPQQSFSNIEVSVQSENSQPSRSVDPRKLQQQNSNMLSLQADFLRSSTEKDTGSNNSADQRVFDPVGGSVEHSLPLDEPQDEEGDQRVSGDCMAGGAPSEDGYNWRKYGQKQVKGSEYPRSYYKCTHPTCQVKKKVERSHEGHITEIIYKGAHNHPKPPPNRRSSIGSSNPLIDMQLELPLQLFMSMGVLFSVVGLGAIPGIVPLVICGFLNMPFAKIIQKCQSEVMISQDERLRAISEILNSMKIIKLQSWEDKFKSLIESLRGKEFKWLSKQQFLRPYGTVLYWIAPTIVSSVVFLGCALFGSAPLNAGTIFTVLATLRSMAEPVRMLPEALSILIQVKVSFDRINTFLLDDELRNDEVRRFPLQNSDKSVTVEAGNFSWVPEIAIPTLRNVDLEIKRGQKIAVCGPVGAGKSSILYAMLGEIPKLSGTVSVFGSIAYVSQVSWIQSGTIRDNILYGKPMDADKYDKAINACALDKDINSFDHGDLTEIGQRGINMSGGQKQRIQLARAIYNDADIYLLDDPFSAVDALTASILFNDCVMTALAKKTVVLVTHQVEFLSEVDRILVMDGGQITQSGSYEKLLMAGTAFEQLVNAHRDSITALGSLNGQGEGESRGIAPLMFNGCSPTKQNSEGEISVKGPPGIQLTQDEEVEIGDVGWKPFMDYVSISKGSVYLSLSILTQLTFVVLQATSTYWLAFSIQIPNMTNSMLIGVYTGVATLSAVFVFFRSHYAAHLGLKASKAFHSGLTNAIFKAPMLFFDSTPVGRILTRASSDMSILDFDIPFAFVFVAAGVTEVLTTVGIMAFITWQVLIVAILAMVAVKYIQGYYMSSARELIRINGTTKAPVMNYAAETSLGVVTIRAFNMVDRFFRNNLKLVDTDATLFFLSNAAMEWLVLRIETLQNLTLFTAAFFLLLLPKNQVTPGLVGLSLSYALSLTGTQIFASRWYCSLWNYMISVERIKQFMHIPEEPPAIIEDNRPPSSWPSKGRIELQELKIRYRSNAPSVLKGITCTFQEGNRVGVVGRTGSGKTTLISALFRLVEPASGKILIDGLDICSMGLKDLRMKLSIIPQEPTLFRGSIRTNLDPLGLYSDDEIWKALEKCQLKTTISALPNKLDSSVSDEGENWSVGQRQLFCLGRVLLKRNRILVLDEATASIDSATDAILQRIIREEFSNCTVITVAHRVLTVIDSDMVMVLSYGKLLEYDEPSNLLATNSSFSKLVAEYWSSCRRNSYQNFSSYQ